MSSDFIASREKWDSMSASTRTWPRFTASNSHPRLTDLLHACEDPTGPDVATSNEDLPERLFRTRSSISEISVVPVSLPGRRRHFSESAIAPDKGHKERAFFAIEGLYATVSEENLQPSVLSARGARRFGLPPKPHYRPHITGVVSERNAEPGERQADAALVSVELADIVDGVPFEKSVVGVRLMSTRNIVVCADANVFYATSTAPPDGTPVRLMRLDADNRNDQRIIEKYLAFKRRLKTNAMMNNPPLTVVNVARTLTQRAGSPDIDTVRTALDTLTSPLKLMSYVENCRARLSSRQRFDADFHKRDLEIYRTLLGDDLVFEENGQWNLSHDAGIADLRMHLMSGNLAFAVVGAESGVNVYFATSDSERLEGLRLHIHETMGDADAVDIGDITFIDAKRRLAGIATIANASGPSRARVNLPTLAPPGAWQPERFRDAEQILAAAIEHDMREDPIITGIHVNSLLDTCDSCAVALPMLGQITGQDITFVYHRDYGVTSAISEDRRIRMLKMLATIANQLRGAFVNGDHSTLRSVSNALLVPEMLGVIASTLHISSRSEAHPKIYPIANALYLHLLASLIREDAIFGNDTVAMLRSNEGKTYVALIGYRIRNDPYLARAWCTLMRELTLAGVPAEALRAILLARANQHLRSFWLELLSARSTTREDHLDQVYHLLKQEDLNPSLVNSRRECGLLDALWIRALRYLKISRRAPAKLDRSQRVESPIPEVLEAIRTVISERSVIELEQERLRNELRDAMPTMTLGEQRDLRNMIMRMVDEAWRAELPGESPPSDIVQSVLTNVGSGLGRHLSAHRGPAIREIIDATIERYGKHLYRYADATEEQMAAAYREHVKSASTRYTALLADDVTSDTSGPSGVGTEIQTRVSVEARILKERQARKAALTAEHEAAKAREAAKQAMSSTSNRARAQAQDRAKEEVRRAAMWATKDATRAMLENAKKEAHIKSQREAREAAARIAGDRIRAATAAAKREARVRAEAVVKQRIAERRQTSTEASRSQGWPAHDKYTDARLQFRLDLLRIERLAVESSPIGEASNAGETSRARPRVAQESTQ
ncbi:hypothetical protein [Pandoraea sputorum]|uniref:hypothetical protein n=1 Tax=Pandoraea sputorum TaxID=93222 RepID=UPI00123F932D|nr:hypothetical protein [Pandoraea sputorum]